MKYKIWNDEDKDESKIHLALRLCEGRPMVIAVDENGKELHGGWICEFTPSGRLATFSGLDKNLGFKLTDRGDIITCRK